MENENTDPLMTEELLEKLEKKAQRKFDEAVEMMNGFDKEYAGLVESMKLSILSELEQALSECGSEGREEFLEFAKGVIDELIRREQGMVDLRNKLNTIRCSHRRAYKQVKCPSCEKRLEWNPTFENTKWCWTSCCGLHFQMTVECVKVEIRRTNPKDGSKPFVPSAKFTFVFGEKEL